MSFDRVPSTGGRGGGEEGGDDIVVVSGDVSDDKVHGARNENPVSPRPRAKSVPAWLNSRLWSSSGGNVAEGEAENKEKEEGVNKGQQAGESGEAERGNEYIPRVSLGKRSPDKENHETWLGSLTSAPRHMSPPQRHSGASLKLADPPRGRVMSPRRQHHSSSSSSMLLSAPGLLGRLRWTDDKSSQAKSDSGELLGAENWNKFVENDKDGIPNASSTSGNKESSAEANQPLAAGGRRLSASLSHGARVAQFQLELSKTKVNLSELRRLASQGIPEGASIRATTWKLLLGYLPKPPSEWEAALAKKRAEYQQFKLELIINPSEAARKREEAASADRDSDGTLERVEIVHEDHPLSMGSSSVWNQYFQDTELAEQIDRDVRRTHPDMHFFNSGDQQAEENQAAMKRALFIFAKLNPGIRYVQGMNEVMAPLLYVFKTDPEASNSEHAEEDAFFCFVELLSDFRDNFCQQLDNSDVGIRSTISRLSMLLRRHDDELWQHLDQKNKVNPQFYAFRWITLLLTQEFSFPDSLRLWDSLLSDPEGPLEILLRVCCAMLVWSREQLLAGDFAANLKLLQNFPSVDVHQILATAERFKPPSLDPTLFPRSNGPLSS